MNPETPRQLALSLSEVEMAFEMASQGDSSFIDEAIRGYLDLETGRIAWTDAEEDTDEEMDFAENRFLPLPNGGDRLEYGDLEEFIGTVEHDPTRRKLSQAIAGRGAFRKFKDIIHGGGDIELRHAWHCFETRRLRQQIMNWLQEAGIEPHWDQDPLKMPELPNRRPELLSAVLEFVRRARGLDGIRRIALLGSLATGKAQPKDVDLLVIVDGAVSLEALARATRQLLSKAMQSGESRGADVFLAEPSGCYIGRVCQWKECRPGIRMACEAKTCGRREYLYDDLQNIQLDADVVAHPPIELWPDPGRCSDGFQIPGDVSEIMLEPLVRERP